MFVKVFGNIVMMFLDLAANACKRDGPVVVDFVLFSLLEDCSLQVFVTVLMSKLFGKIMARSGEISAASSFMILAGSISE